jgi:hypothetical protein
LQKLTLISALNPLTLLHHCCIMGLIISVLAFIGDASLKTVLYVLGFTSVGPAAGTAAASMMSSVAAANGGAVAAGSTYALAQSVAMGGATLATGVSAGIGAAVVAAGGAIAKGITYVMSMFKA